MRIFYRFKLFFNEIVLVNWWVLAIVFFPKFLPGFFSLTNKKFLSNVQLCAKKGRNSTE